MQIVDLKWVRANLVVKLDKKIDKDCYLCFNNKKIKLETSNDEINIPIYNTPSYESIGEGVWHIEIDNELIKISDKLLSSLDDKTRIFKYKKNFYALLITYDVTDDLEFYINANYMMKNTKYKKLDRYAPYNIFGKLKVLIVNLIIIMLNILYKIANLISFRNNDILFLSENSNEMPINMKELYDNVESKYKKKTFFVDVYNRYNKLKRFIELFKIASCKYIFVDNYVGLLNRVRVSKKQQIIQLWHAGIGFKAVGYARFGKSGGPHPFISSHRKYTTAVVDKENLIEVYNEVFGTNKDIFIDTGIPRLDNYLDKDLINKKQEELFNKYEILKDKKIIIYAPTYRGNGSGSAYFDYNVIDLKRINDFCKKNNFVFIIKMHPFIKELLKVPSEYNNILELSEENINDLIYISDIMITDYSSCAYEFSFFNRILVFYRFDKELYEYLRPIHTADSFCKKQFEVETFDDLMSVLVKNKDIDIKKRFSNVSENRENSAKKILDNVLGE